MRRVEPRRRQQNRSRYQLRSTYRPVQPLLSATSTISSSPPSHVAPPLHRGERTHRVLHGCLRRARARREGSVSSPKATRRRHAPRAHRAKKGRAGDAAASGKGVRRRGRGPGRATRGAGRWAARGPSPPNFGLSRQFRHAPQSSLQQASHRPQATVRLRFFCDHQSEEAECAPPPGVADCSESADASTPSGVRSPNMLVISPPRRSGDLYDDDDLAGQVGRLPKSVVFSWAGR